MPRGRHRQAPPLHRLLAPSAVAVVALLCAVGAWLVGETDDPAVLLLRVLTAVAALSATAGAVLLRQWDREAGRRVGEVRAAKATAEWRAEERQSELENELEESIELRGKAEAELRSKQGELERLRTEHAALLRRYATAETERASALEGRRLLALETAGPAKELTTGAADHRRASGAPTPLTYLQADEALRRLRTNAARQREREAWERREAERAAAEERERAAASRVPARGLPRDGVEPYRQGAGETGGGATAPKRGGFDFFGTQGPQRRRRAPGGPRGSAESPSDQDEDGHRAGPTPEPAPEPAPEPTPAPEPVAVPRAPRAVAGKVIDLGEPDAADSDGRAGAEDVDAPTGRRRRRTRA
ncbi:hypothetical protein [Streptomyces megasporus]|uniref:hypothetical protein n=1 Tax=Streptomyces megasporus TaxID=44060 RepID=UPI000691A78E|nr:hypothetical protein [Streptomyces megasporus]